MSPAVRLQKVLAAAGVASRRGADELIAAGRVTVDGRVAALGERVEEGSALIAVDGHPIGPPPVADVYVACNKPVGVTSTVRDRHAESTVVDLVPAALRPRGGRLVPVGRLDKDSEGLILLTSDGGWAYQVLHPRHGVERDYAVGVRWPLGSEQEARLRTGVDLDEGVARVVRVEQVSEPRVHRLGVPREPSIGPPLTWYLVTLRTGWKRQVRRMFAATGDPVARLVRVRVGAIRLGSLPTGSCRALTEREVAAMRGGAGRPVG